MPTTTRKPWLANLVWATALLLGLAVLYVGSYGCALWLNGRSVNGEQALSGATLIRLQETVFLPIHLMADSGVPGGRTVQIFGMWCYYRGEGRSVTWREIADPPTYEPIIQYE